MKFFRLILTASCGALALSGCGSSTSTNNSSSNSASTPAASTTAKTDAGKSATQNFVNSPDGLKGALKDNYVGFSFDYPSSWKLVGEAGDPNASNFVKVENALHDKARGDMTQENFAVGYFQSAGDAAGDAKLFPVLVKQLSTQFAQGFPHFQKVSEGATKLNKYNGYEFRFSSRLDKTKFGPVNLWGRVILLPDPKPKGKHGAALILLATDRQKDLKSAADVGAKGGFPVILKSFKFE